ncbi:small, acid-soluble spore protein, alpha/beta type [Desulfoscipio geothermicus]|uniref:Small acid-soluble spore protein F (Minor alpha/beta-type SASP) n=1 Tax=Desulfoscipio geothermicus DSM 3669 TaxID=1121426 RepID=A0A1I6DR10_9FIRM|nr:small, acid-soluble spore protein, alpha/beta type [Desulfoscipio geothermicus]SFR07874.1 small acid-soluble spore protein F (minor alpha/beta-type SASP) [Desulfoscipio geothermicus DSM 3669]
MAKYLSDKTKYEFARELGVADQVIPGGSLYFGYVSSENCGNFVKLAIKRMEQTMV